MWDTEPTLSEGVLRRTLGCGLEMGHGVLCPGRAAFNHNLSTKTELSFADSIREGGGRAFDGGWFLASLDMRKTPEAGAG